MNAFECKKHSSLVSITCSHVCITCAVELSASVERLVFELGLSLSNFY